LSVTDTEMTNIALQVTTPPRTGRRAVARQFIQFCLVGAVSTALNIALGNLFLVWGFGVNAAHVCAFTLAVTNGFFLNRAWTFRHADPRNIKQQYVMFVGVNLVGLVLSWLVMRGVMGWLLHTHLAHSLAGALHASTGRLPDVERLAYSLGELGATPLVAVWNFSANRLWTFKGTGK
jgi:putative flippase GtrA